LLLQRQWGHDLDFLGLRDVVSHVTIWLAVGHFLWGVHCDHASILHRYGIMKPQMLNGRTDAQVILYTLSICPMLCIALDRQ